MTQICDTRGPSCFPCPDNEPLLNLSAEGPDNELWVGVYDFPGVIPLNNEYSNLGCKSWCYSTVSQEDADHCAQQQATLCFNQDNGPSNPGCGVPGLCPPGKGGPTPVILYYSNAQSCGSPCDDGTDFNFSLPAGYVISNVSQADADLRALSYCQALAGDSAICFLNAPPGACTSSDYDFTFDVEGGVEPYTFSLTGPLPSGLLFDPASASIVGFTSATPEAQSFSVTCTDSDTPPNIKTNEFTISVGQINTTTLPDATIGVPYNQVLTQSGMLVPVEWFILEGDLPAGLSLNASTGVISGIPTVNAGVGFTAGVEGDDGTICSKVITPSEWFYTSFFVCIPNNTPPMAGVNCAGLAIDINAAGCIASGVCGEGVFVPSSQFFNFTIARTIGPFPVDKAISISGTWNFNSDHLIVPGCTCTGSLQMSLAATGLTAYSGDVFHGVSCVAPLPSSGTFLITGTLPAGTTSLIKCNPVANDGPAGRIIIAGAITIT